MKNTWTRLQKAILQRKHSLGVSLCVVVGVAGASIIVSLVSAVDAPVVTNVSPNTGPLTGGQTVTIDGSGFFKDAVFSRVSSGTSHSCGIVEGEVYCWGYNGGGELGSGTYIASSTPIPVRTQGTPMEGKTITAIATGDSLTVALDSTGQVYSWGKNTFGQLGNNSTTQSFVPVAVTTTGVLSGKTITAISAVGSHTVALDSAGIAYTWGLNNTGQLGNNSTTQSQVPVAVTATGVLSGKTITAISAGYSHTLALDSTGVTYSWGGNVNGQLGNNSTTQSLAPVVVLATGVLSGKTITAVSTGYGYSAVLDSTGRVYTWGVNTNGQLGNNSTTQSLVPVAVIVTGALVGKTITAISTGYSHTAALDSTGVVYSWGINGNGRLGNNSTTQSQVPVAVTVTGVLSGKTITAISAGYSHTVAMDSTGLVYTWGDNAYGKLGDGTVTQRLAPVVTSGSVPIMFSLIIGGNAALITSQTAAKLTFATPSHAVGSVDIGLTANAMIPLTLTDAYTYINPPTLTGVNPAAAYNTGGDTVTISGSDFTASPTVKFGETVATSVTRIDATTLTAVVPPSSSLGPVDITVVNNDSEATSLPRSFTYKKVAPTISSVTPGVGPLVGNQTVTLTGPDLGYSLQFKKITSGYVHGCGIANSRVYCWGGNVNGQLGNGSTADSSTPVAVAIAGTPMADKNITAIEAGDNYTLALASDGTIYGWGLNNNGQLGNGSTTQSNVPVAVTGTGALAGKTATAISAGGNSSLALASDGTIFTWGGNGYGSLGTGNSANSSVPIAVVTSGTPMAGKNIVSAAIGTTHAVAVDSNGKVYSWGYNANGELGNGTTTQSLVPVAVTATGVLLGKTIRSVAVSGNDGNSYGHSLALDSNGKVYGWGTNGFGQLGDSTTTQSLVPVAVTATGVLAGKTITAIVAGGYSNTLFSIALASDGTVYGWGYNGYGQLGNSATGQSAVPVATTTTSALSGKTITAVAAGQYHTLALGSDAQTYSWGRNANGQLGDGTIIQRISPVAVTQVVPIPFIVTFGGIATTMSSQTPTTITLKTPAHGAGQVAVGLTATDVDELTVPAAYEYAEAPTVSLLSPSTGYDTGGDTVTITGNYFRPGATVKFGHLAPVAVTYINATTLQVVTPVIDHVGALSVTVANVDGQSVMVGRGFAFQRRVTVTSVTPNAGPLTGGSTVKLTGSGFYTALHFDTVATGAMGSSCGISNGEAYCWGSNTFGQLGNGTTIESLTPTKVAQLPGGLENKTVTDISINSNTLACVIADGEAYCWGKNATGQLGDGTTVDSRVPVKVSQLPGALQGKTLTRIVTGGLGSGSNASACVIADGEVYCWGYNGNGQLGINSTTQSLVPVKVTQTAGLLLGKKVTAISLSSLAGCAIANDEVYCWGAGGMLGNSSATQSLVPVKVTQTAGSLLGKKVTYLIGGYLQTCSIADGEIYCWGGNNYGELGNGTTTASTFPVRAGGLTGATSVGAGMYASCGIAAGRSYCWGNNGGSQFGNGTQTNNLSPTVTTATGVLSGKTLRQIIVGGSITCAVDTLYQAYCWGYGTSGELGNGTKTVASVPGLVTQSMVLSLGLKLDRATISPLTITPTDISYIAPAHGAGKVSLELSALNVESLPLTDAYEYLPPPSDIAISPSSGTLAGGDAAIISGSGFRADSKVWFNDVLASTTYVNSTTLNVITPAGITAARANIWVVNGDGQESFLSQGYTYILPQPTVTTTSPNTGPAVGGTGVTLSGTDLTSKARFVQVSSGTSHSCGVTQASEVYCWGLNSNGQLGNNSTTQSLVPVKVTQTSGLLLGKTVTSITTGADFTCAIASGEAYCWGYNFYGGLGNGTLTQSNVPVKVTQTSGLLLGKTVTAISAGEYHVCVAANNEAYCWGRNYYGSLGNSGTTDSSVPIKVTQTSGLLLGKTVTAVSAGDKGVGDYTCVVASGEAFCWGYNANGRLGNSTATQSTAPVRVTQTNGVLLGKTVTSITTGVNHTCAIASGEAYCWGDNVSGQLGNNSTTQSLFPVAVDATGSLNGKVIATLTAGGTNTHAIDSTGRAYAWGSNQYGELGDGNAIPASPYAQTVPVMVRTKSSFTDISGGINHTCAIPLDASLYCWGLNTNGRLGDSTTINHSLPATINRGSIADESVFTSLVIGGNTAAITSSLSTSLAFITPAHSAGPVDITLSADSVSLVTKTNAFVYLAPPTATNVSPSVGLKTGGDSITVTGANFGVGTTVTIGGGMATSVNIVNATTLTAITPTHTVGLVDIIVTNGDSQMATLQNSFTYIEPAPTVTMISPNAGPLTGGQSVTVTGTGFVQGVVDFTQISAGANHTCGIADNEAYCWGANTNGQLGNNSTAQSNVPIKVTQTAGLLLGKTVTSITASVAHTCAVADNEAYCWGANTNGKLGNNSTTQSNVPVKVTQTSGFLLDKIVSSISAGYNQTCAIADNEAYCWGNNGNGQLGNNSTAQSNVPIKVTQANGLLLDKTVSSVVTGSYHSCAIADNEAYCWGNNGNGQLGNNSTAQSNVPIKVTQANGLLLDKTVTGISPGSSTTCATASGEAYCWGNNGNSQLGNNSTAQSNVPIKVTQANGLLLDKTVTDVMTDGNTTCATASGEAYCWGGNSYGQLGNNSTIQSNAPIKVTQTAGLLLGKTVTKIAESPSGHTCTLAVSGEVYCWGLGNSGQLGGSIGANSLVPVAVAMPSILPKVTIAGALVSGVQFISSTQLRGVTPAGIAGQASAVVQNYDMQSATLTNGYEYVAAPTISAISPSSGSMGGGDTVTITGTKFTSPMTVTIGGSAATNVVVVNANTLTATVAASGLPGPVDVTASDSLGQTSTIVGGFTYILPASTVTSISPTVSKMTGGGAVTITGAGFVAKAGGGSWYDATIGGVAATNVTYVNATTLTATIPVHTPGRVNVAVGGTYTNTTTLVNALTYMPAAYAFTSTALNVAASEAGTVRVEARDGAGNPITSTDNIVLNLTTSTGTGYFAKTLIGGNNWNETSVIIPAGQSSVTFYYKDSQQGTPIITVTDIATTSASQQETVGPRYKLLVTGVTNPTNAGVPSSITIQAIDAAGNPQFDYTGTVQFTTTDTSALKPSNYVMKASDHGGRTFVNGITMATPGEHCVTVTDTVYPSISGSQCNIIVNPAGEGTVSQLAIITPSQSFPLSSTSSAITVQTQDIAGTPTVALGATPVFFYSTSSTGQLSLDGETGWTNATAFEVTIPSGATSANVYYRDTTAGDHMLTARDDAGMGADLGWENTTQDITVGVGTPSKISFAAITAGSAGQWVPVTVELRDASDNTVTATRNVPLQFTSDATSARYSLQANGANSATTLDATIGAGSKSVTIYVQDTINHQLVLQASDLSPPVGGVFASITQPLDFSAASVVRVAFMPKAIARTYEPTSLTVYLQDVYGNTVITETDISVDFTTSAGSGGFSLSASAPWSAPLSGIITQGTSGVTVYYRDTEVGSRTITANSNSLISATLDLEIAPLLYDPADGGQLKFTTAPTSYVAGEPQTLTVGLFDEYNNLTTATGDTSLSFSGGSSYSIDGGLTWAASQTITIPTGQSYGSVSARSTQVSDPRYPVIQYAQQPAWPLRKISNTISVAADAPSKYVITSSEQIIAKNATSDAISIQLKDAYDNISPAPAGFTATITSSSPTGEFQLDSAQSWQSTLSMPFVTGSTESGFYYRDSSVQTATMTIARSGMASATQDIRVIEAFVAKTTLSAPTSTQAGEIVPLTLTTRSAGDIEVPVLTATNFTLSGPGEFSLASNPWSPITTATLAKDQSSLALYYRATILGETTIGAAENPARGWVDASSDLVVNPGVFYRYSLTAKPLTTPVTESSSVFVATAQDVYGNITTTTSDTPTYLYTDSNTGSFALSSTGPWTAEAVSIPNGGSSASFYYKDTTLGRVASLNISDQQPLEAPDAGILNATTSVRVVGQTIEKMSILTARQTVVAGEFSTIVTVQAQKNNGSPAIQDEELTLGLSGAVGATFYSAPNNANAISQLNIAAGESTASFYVKEQKSGTTSISVSGPVTTSQPLTVLAAQPSSVRFITAGQTKQAGVDSDQITVELRDQFNNQAKVDSDMNLAMSSNCSDGLFSTASGAGWNDTTVLPVMSGMSSATFYYRETVAGSCNLTVGGSGLTSASQAYGTTAATAVRLAFTVKPTTLVVGQNATMRASLLDVYGNIATWSGANKIINVTTTSPSGVFSPATSATLYAGYDGVTFTYRDTTLGVAEVIAVDQPVGALDTGLFDVMTSIEVVEGTATTLAISPNPLNIVAGELGAVTVQLHNEYGAAINTKTDSTVYLLSANASGSFKASNNMNAPDIEQTSIPAGQSEVTIYYQQTEASLVDLTSSYSSDGQDTTASIKNGTIEANILPAEITDTVFATAPKELEINQPSGNIVVQALDEFGNVTIFESPTQLYLSSTSPTARFSRTALFTPQTFITTITASAGSTAATFQYKDTTSGTDTITVSDVPGGDPSAGLLGASQTVTVDNGAVAKLVFEGATPNLERGEVSGAMNIVTKNAFDAITTSENDQTVYLTSGNATGQFALSPGGPWDVTQVVILAGESSSAPLYYRNTTYIGSTFITAADVLRSPNAAEIGLIDASQNATIVAGPFAQLAYVTVPQTMIAKHPSSLMQVKALNRYGFDTTVTVATAIYLRSTSGAGEFADSTTAWGANFATLVPTETNNSTTSFYYRDGEAGAPTISASNALGTEASIIRATQQQTIEAQVQAGFRVANISDPQYQGSPSSVVVAAVDAEGYIIDWYDGTISFASSDSDAVLPEPYTFIPGIDRGIHTFTNGAAFASQGEKTVTVSDSNGQVGSQQDITVVGAPPTVLSKVVFVAPVSPLTVTRTEVSEVITVQLQDVAGSSFLAGTGGYPLRLHSSSLTGEFSNSPGGPWQTSLVAVVPAGLNYANVYYRDVTGGTYTLTASDWQSNTDTLAITNDSLEAIVRTLDIDLQATIYSRDYAGAMIINPYLFARSHRGDMSGYVTVAATSRDIANDTVIAGDWEVKLGGVAPVNYQNTSSISYQSSALTPVIGTSPYSLGIIVTSGDLVGSRDLQVPVSPWLAELEAVAYENRHLNAVLRTTQNSSAADVNRVSFVLSASDGVEVGRWTLAQLLADVSANVQTVGRYTMDIPVELQVGEYQLVTELSDGIGITAQDSVMFTASQSVIDDAPLVPAPIAGTPPSTSQPADPVIPESTATDQPVGSGTAQPGSAGASPAPSNAVSTNPSLVHRILASPTTPRAVAQILFGVIGLIATLLAYQAYKEWRRATWLMAIIKKNSQTVTDKNAFLQLASHHLQKPMVNIATSIKSLKSMTDESVAKLIGNLQVTAAGLQSRIDQLVNQTNSSADIASITTVNAAVARIKILLSPIFWLPVILSIILTLLCNWAIVSVGGQIINGSLLVNQVLLISFGIIVLYVAVRALTIRREQRQLLDESRQKVEALNRAKNIFAQNVHVSLADDILRLGGYARKAATLQSNSASDVLVKGSKQLEELVSRFAILNHIETDKPKQRQFAIVNAVDEAIRELASEVDLSGLTIEDQVVGLEIKQDKQLVKKILSSIITNLTTAGTTSRLVIDGSRQEDGTIALQITGPAEGDAAGVNLYNTLLNANLETTESVKNSDQQGLQSLDLYLNRLMVDSLGGTIATHKTGNRMSVLLKLPSLA